MSAAIPTVVIVGRPNVGKSTLFNRITGKRRAIVGDEPGITRDRIHGTAEHDGRRFELIDTGGIVVADQEYIPAQILRRLGKPVSLAVNKIDTASKQELAHQFYELGIGDVFPVSAEHGTGVDALLDRVTTG